jgi:Rps23 Pro-64 3,4-dihydroxylase Tpa1-like proline 4-hydroxylase
MVWRQTQPSSLVRKRKEKEVVTSKSLTPTRIIAGAVAVYEDAWHNFLETISLSVSQEDIDFIAASTFDPKTGQTFVNKIRNTDTLGITKNSSTNDHFKNLDTQCKELIYNLSSQYKQALNIRDQIVDEENYSLLRYSPGQYYREHYDGPTASARSVSVLIYLNDDYEGGEIEFINFNEKLKPKAGTVILFPSNYAYRHIAHPVVSGTKYVITTFLHDRKKEL